MTRTEVVADAIAKCQTLSGKLYDRREIFLVGDSPSDVEAEDPTESTHWRLPLVAVT